METDYRRLDVEILGQRFCELRPHLGVLLIRKLLQDEFGNDADLVDARTGGADAGDVNNVPTVADRQMTAALTGITQLLYHRLADLRHIQ